MSSSIPSPSCDKPKLADGLQVAKLCWEERRAPLSRGPLAKRAGRQLSGTSGSMLMWEGRVALYTQLSRWARVNLYPGFLGGSAGKESAHNWGHVGWIPGSRRPPGGGNSNPLQCSCLENPTEEFWQATVHGVTKSRTRLRQLTHTQTFIQSCIFWL